MSLVSGLNSRGVLPLRVMMLTESYLPLAGGIERHVLSLSRELVARGHDVSVVTLWHPNLPSFERDDQIRIYRVHGAMEDAIVRWGHTGRVYAPPCPDPRTLWGLHRIVQREQPDIIHAHNWLVHSYLPLKRAWRAPLVMSLHTYGLVCSKHSLLHFDEICSGPAFTKCLRCMTASYGRAKGPPIVVARFATMKAERKAVDMFLPVSCAVADGNQLEDSNLPYEIISNFVPNDVASLPNDVDNDGEWRMGELPTDPYLMFVGALQRHKGEDVLIEAYEGMEDPPPLVLITIAGPRTPAHFPRGVTVLKNVPHSAVMAAWKRSLVGVVPSTWPEPCATVVLEAMAAGRPVIASRIGGNPEMIDDGRTGFLVPPGEPLALRRAIEQVIADSDLRRQMGQEAQRKIVDFQASTVVPRVERVYERLLRQQQRRKNRHNRA